MLEAKVQGHKFKCFPKQKKTGLQKNFLAISKKFSKKFFRRLPKKTKVFEKICQAIYKILQFKKYCCPRAENRAIFEGRLEAARPRTSKCVLEVKDVLEDSTSGPTLLFALLSRPHKQQKILSLR